MFDEDIKDSQKHDDGAYGSTVFGSNLWDTRYEVN